MPRTKPHMGREKKMEKLDLEDMIWKFTEHDQSMTRMIIDKLNEIVDYLNEEN